MDKIEITEWKSLYDTTGTRRTLRWAELVEEFSRPLVCAAKSQAPGWSPGTFTSRRSRAQCEQLYCVALDYESSGGGGTPIAKIKFFWGDACGLVHTTYSHTPTNPRARLVLLLSRPVSGPVYERIVGWVQSHALAAGHQIDEKTGDCSRFWYSPSMAPDSEYEIAQLTGRPLDVDSVLESLDSAEKKKRLESRANDEPSRDAGAAISGGGRATEGATIEAAPNPERYYQVALDSAIANIRSAPEGNRNNTIAREAYALAGIAAGIGADLTQLETNLLTVCRTACWPGYDDSLTRGTIRRQIAAGNAQPRAIPDKKKAKERARAKSRAIERDTSQGDTSGRVESQGKPVEAASDLSSDSWQNELIHNDRGVIGNLANIATILSHGPWAGVFRYNVCESAIEVCGSPPAIRPGPRQLGTGDEETITIWLQKQWSFNNVSPQKTFDAIRSVASQNQYNPITDWLDSLTWDCTPRIERWLTTYAGVHDSEYTRAVGLHWIRSVAARGLTPGAKCDYILVFEGRQGDKKSTLFEVLGGRFYAAPPSILGDRAVQNMSGKLIVCLEELESLEKSEIGALKAQITRRVDRLRLPWARTASDIPRTATLAGTCNRDDYLRDETGNRRFWPVKVGKISIEELARDRDQLLAEAVHQVRGGAQWWLPDNLEALALVEAQSRVMVDVWADRVESFLENKDSVTLEQVLESLGVELSRMTRADQMRVATLLRGGGWSKRQTMILGKRSMRWFRAEQEQE